MFATVFNYQREAANDGVLLRTRTVPIPTSITAVPNYPNKLVVYKIAASKYWQVRCWHAGRSHKRSTKTTKLNLAQRFARWFYEQLLVKHSTHANLIAANSATADTDTAKQLTFGAVAAQVYANEQARVERGEYGAGSLRMFRNRLDAQILPAIGAKYIDQITYQLLLLFAQSLSAKFSTTTVSHYLVIVRKVLTHAKRTELIEQVPDVPKIKVRSTSRGAFTPTEYWQLLRAARALRGATHPDTRKDMRKKLHQCYNNNMPPDVAWAIGFMVNSFIRPGDLVKLRHRHVEVVHSRQTYLRLTLPETKLHDAPIVTLQPAVRIYQQICQYQTAHKRANTNDHVFLPDIPNRQYAMNVLGYMFNWVLQHTGLKLNAHGNPRSLYSLRHSAITFRLLYGQGIDLITLARNARTSVEVINNHYANRVNNYRAAVKLRNQSEHEYETACEYLQEQLDMCSAAEQALIQAWLDRPFEYGTHGTISVDCMGVARVIGSNSKYCLHKNERAQQQLSWQLQCQQQALSAAAYDLLYLPEPECAVDTGVVSKKLQSLLANLHNNQDI